MNSGSGRAPSAPQPTVADLMRRDVVTIAPDATVRELTRLLDRHRVSGVPVVDENRRVLGMVSVSDLRWLADWFAGEEWGFGVRARAAEHLDRKRVRDIMTPDVFGVGPDATVQELALFFARTGLGRAVVMEGGRLVGIVSAIDLLRLVAGRPHEAEQAGDPRGRR